MKAATLALLVTGWLFSLTVLQHAQETKPDTSCAPALGADDEVVVAARAYQTFWVKAYEECMKSAVEPFPSAEIIPGAEKLCQDVVKKAVEHKRQDIADAATLQLEAFKYTRENLSRERAKRTKPSNAKLQELYGENATGVTDGFLLKGFQISTLRFNRLLGSTHITEKEIRAMEDFDLQDALAGARPADAQAGNGKDIQEHVIRVKNDDTLRLDGTKIETVDELKAPLQERISRAAKVGKTVRITLGTDEQAKYNRVVDVMNILAAVKITNVTFTVAD
jgi:biopolymer transport protein ExbD